MKSIKIVRKVDDLGKIVIPMVIRKSVGINEGDQMEYFIDGENIVLRKYNGESVEQPKEIKELHCKVCNHILNIKKDNIYKVNVKNFIFKTTSVMDAIDCPYCGCQNLLNERYEKVRNNSNV